MVDIYERIGTSEKILSEQAKEELAQCVTIAEELFEQAITAVATDNVDQAEQVIQDKKRMRKAQKKTPKSIWNVCRRICVIRSLPKVIFCILLNLDHMWQITVPQYCRRSIGPLSTYEEIWIQKKTHSRM